VTVTVGLGTGILTVTVGAGFRPCGGLVAPSRSAAVIVATSVSPMAAAIASQALDRSRIRGFRRCLRPGREACGVITPSMVAVDTERIAKILNDSGRASGIPETAQAPDAIAWGRQERALLRSRTVEIWVAHPRTVDVLGARSS
jgi:hypothetical protein